MTTPRGLTQPFTSFIGSACQGIHHAPLITNTQTTTHKSAGGHTSELDKINTKKKSHKHTQHTTQKRSLPHVFNARVHYTVLTQHPNHKPAHTNHAHQQNGQAPKKGIMPQTPNNAPTYKQILFSNCARHCVSQSAIQTLGLCLKGVSSTRKFSNKQRWQHDTRTLNQHLPH